MIITFKCGFGSGSGSKSDPGHKYFFNIYNFFEQRKNIKFFSHFFAYFYDQIWWNYRNWEVFSSLVDSWDLFLACFGWYFYSLDPEPWIHIFLRSVSGSWKQNVVDPMDPNPKHCFLQSSGFSCDRKIFLTKKNGKSCF